MAATCKEAGRRLSAPGHGTGSVTPDAPPRVHSPSAAPGVASACPSRGRNMTDVTNDTMEARIDALEVNLGNLATGQVAETNQSLSVLETRLAEVESILADFFSDAMTCAVRGAVALKTGDQ